MNEGVKILSRCPVCRDSLNNLEAKVLGTRGETRSLHLTCHNCNNSLLALVLISGEVASSVGVLTDLSFEDTLKFRGASEVGLDDVLEIHEQSKNKDFLARFQP